MGNIEPRQNIVACRATKEATNQRVGKRDHISFHNGMAGV